MSLAGTLQLWISLSLAALFALSALPKLTRPAAFMDSLGSYRFLPGFLMPACAILVPVVELAVAAGLCFPSTRPIALAAAAAMLAVYCVAVGAAWWLGAGGEDCGCGGDEGVPIGGWLLARNVLLLSFVLAGLAFPDTREPGKVGGLIAAIGVIVAAFVYDWINVFIRSEYETD